CDFGGIAEGLDVDLLDGGEVRILVRVHIDAFDCGALVTTEAVVLEPVRLALHPNDSRLGRHHGDHPWRQIHDVLVVAVVRNRREDILTYRAATPGGFQVHERALSAHGHRFFDPRDFQAHVDPGHEAGRELDVGADHLAKARE